MGLGFRGWKLENSTYWDYLQGSQEVGLQSFVLSCFRMGTDIRQDTGVLT